MIDKTPIKLFGQNLRITQSTEDLKQIHVGCVLGFQPVQIIVKDVSWTDQGWGN
jgi:hypothetical protein